MVSALEECILGGQIPMMQQDRNTQRGISKILGEHRHQHMTWQPAAGMQYEFTNQPREYTSSIPCYL